MSRLSRFANLQGLSAILVALGLALAVLGGCKKKAEPARIALDPRRGGDTQITSVYPLNVKPEPLAERFCALFHALPKERRAECCSDKPGVMLTAECVRMLSAAIQNKAVELKVEDAARCEAETRRSLEGCAWVGIWPAAIPAACKGIVRGALDRGAECRSSLECKEGLRCAGIDSTQAGRCARPGADGTLCGGTTDPLAVYTRQDDDERIHPPCEGFCDRSRCSAALKEGEACRSNAQCGRDGRCEKGACKKGRWAKVGSPCLGDDCENAARCVSGACVAPKAEGQSCAVDAECIGACIRDDVAALGVCKPACEELIGLKPVRKVISSTRAR